MKPNSLDTDVTHATSNGYLALEGGFSFSKKVQEHVGVKSSRTSEL